MIPIISDDARLAWEEYSVANKGWLTEARVYQAEKGLGDKEEAIPTLATTVVSPIIYRLDQANEFYPDPGVSKRRESRNGRKYLRKGTHMIFIL
jgi:hypothetical protein